MKITTLFTCLFIFGIFAVSAQDISDHTIGLRLGDSDGFGAEISYQKSIGRYNRAEFNLGWRDSRRFDAFKLSGTYQWVHQIEGNFNWYYGFGGGLGSVEFEPEPDGEDNDGLFVFAAGVLGVEYDFDIPLLLSLDFRPEIGILGYDGFNDNFDFDIALGIRYQF
ncbi:hypothetical protein LV716_16030 [Flagellimonas sp. HMM57]|uniref:hypothetical protein n=1 Tax=unclassified Flagellimonas TaxID=2644544 RepID=UPI0013D4EB5A|nr:MULTISPECIES: hypothetical protein [unclassified Flagellimonas]UII75750.1 hypothetical protein LV716_16030 [Flagellimonas sp. HMM57]